MPLLSERRFINLSAVKPGMMVEFDYTRLDGQSGTYRVLVIDPNRKTTERPEPKLHGIDLDGLADLEILEAMASFKTQFDVGVDSNEDRKKSVVQEVNTDEAYANLKNSKFNERRKYRTYNLKEISRVRQILLGALD